MSVGIERIRMEPDVIRAGCIAKGEDPSLVDRALTVDAKRRDLLAEVERERRIRKLDARIHHLGIQLDAILERL